MTPRKSSAKEAKDLWTAFRANARNHLEDARAKEDRLRETMDEDGRTGNAKGIAADAVLAAIAYGDAITVQRLNRHNTQDHGTLPAFVQQAIGKRADKDQIARLGRIVARKNEAHYGGTTWSFTHASDYREQVERFAIWAEVVLSEGER